MDLHVVGAADDRAELEAQLRLARRHLVVMLFTSIIAGYASVPHG